MLKVYSYKSKYNCNFSSACGNNTKNAVPSLVASENPINLNKHPNAINNIAFKGLHPTPQNMSSMNEFAELVKDPLMKRFAIFTHYDPDHDATSSAIIAREILKAKGKIADIFMLKPLKPNAQSLDADKEIKIVANLKNPENPNEPVTAKQLKELYGEYDGIVIVDAHSIDRIDKKFKSAFIDPVKEKLTELVAKDPQTKGRIVIIDHHLNEKRAIPRPDDSYFDNINTIKIIDSSVESASRLGMQLLGAFHLRKTKKISDAIVAGAVSDTESLLYARKNSGIFSDLAKLEKTSDIGKISKEVSSMDFNDFELTKELMNKVKFKENGDIAYFVLDKDLAKKCSEQKICVEKAVNITLTQLSKIRNVKYYFSIIENATEPGRICSTLKSNAKPINTIASEFGGGGHAMASGFTTKTENTENFIESLISKLNDLKNY